MDLGVCAKCSERNGSQMIVNVLYRDIKVKSGIITNCLKIISSYPDHECGDGWGVGRILTSLQFRNAISVHEVFEPGGEIRHHACGSQVKCPLEVLLVIQHPNVDLKSHACTEELRTLAASWSLPEATAGASPDSIC